MNTYVSSRLTVFGCRIERAVSSMFSSFLSLLSVVSFPLVLLVSSAPFTVVLPH